MSAISFAPAGPPLPAQSGRPDLNGGADAGAQDVQKQQRDQDDARAQRLGAQLRQMFAREAVSGAVANSQAADATIAGAVSNARASASAAISSSSSARNGKPHGVGDGGNLGLQDAANLVAGARASINAAKIDALRESQHGDLADLVQLDQQAANAQGAIAINLLV
jgi:hypothetical protein